MLVVFIVVDENGVLHETAYTEFKEKYKEHSETKFVFKGHCIKIFKNVLEQAKKWHMAIPQLGVVNWNFKINENGDPVLIEINLKSGSIWLCKMAHGKGAFGENTENILQWLELMKSLKKSERYQNAFGRM